MARTPICSTLVTMVLSLCTSRLAVLTPIVHFSSCYDLATFQLLSCRLDCLRDGFEGHVIIRNHSDRLLCHRGIYLLHPAYSIKGLFDGGSTT